MVCSVPVCHTRNGIKYSAEHPGHSCHFVRTGIPTRDFHMWEESRTCVLIYHKIIIGLTCTCSPDSISIERFGAPEVLTIKFEPFYCRTKLKPQCRIPIGPFDGGPPIIIIITTATDEAGGRTYFAIGKNLFLHSSVRSVHLFVGITLFCSE